MLFSLGINGYLGNLGLLGEDHFWWATPSVFNRIIVVIGWAWWFVTLSVCIGQTFLDYKTKAALVACYDGGYFSGGDVECVGLHTARGLADYGRASRRDNNNKKGMALWAPNVVACVISMCLCESYAMFVLVIGSARLVTNSHMGMPCVRGCMAFWYCRRDVMGDNQDCFSI